jgi:ABC-2 type transport system permease protein
MQPFLTLVRRELSAYFVSLTGYLVIAGVLVLMGMSFSILLESLNAQPFDQPITEVFYNTGFFWLILLLVVPVVTMRSFAQEKATGTFETLMTAPVDDVEVVLAKFTGALTFFLLMWLPLLAYPFVLRRYATDPVLVAWGPLASTFLGILLIGCLFVAAGCFASSLTRNQLIAATVSFAIGMVMFLLGFLALLEPLQTGWQHQLASHISMIEHMRDFSRGVIDTRHVVLYLTLTVFFLFLNVKVVESRRWK